MTAPAEACGVSVPFRCRSLEAWGEVEARSAGALCGLARTADVVDAGVVIGALRRNDTVFTSDPEDLARLADAAGQPLRIRRI